MDAPCIAYTIFIGTTAEKLWEALTSRQALRANWGRIESQWEVGARVSEVSDSGKVLWEGIVLQSEPSRRLA